MHASINCCHLLLKLETTRKAIDVVDNKRKDEKWNINWNTCNPTDRASLNIYYIHLLLLIIHY